MTNPVRIDWRAELTADERRAIDDADKAKARWQKLNAARAGIVNRAIKRAQYRIQIEKKK